MGIIVGLVGLKQSGKSTALEVIQSIGQTQELQLAKHLKDVCAQVFNIYRPDLDDQNFKEKEFGHKESFHSIRMVVFKKYRKQVEVRKSYRQEPIILTLGMILEILYLFEIPLTPENIEKAKKHVGVVIKTPRYAAQYVGTEIARSFDPDIHINITVKRADPNVTFLVPSDIRFHNEKAAFDKFPGAITIFIRREATIPADIASQHESERYVLDIGRECTHTVTNDGTKEEFEAKIRKIVADLSVKPSTT